MLEIALLIGTRSTTATDNILTPIPASRMIIKTSSMRALCALFTENFDRHPAIGVIVMTGRAGAIHSIAAIFHISLLHSVKKFMPVFSQESRFDKHFFLHFQLPHLFVKNHIQAKNVC